ncbi:histidine kinase [Streptomyces abyssalis]|uniref:histidine kinase n=1 Tax=Streptomyces abyssalis TaxID=933944 RepID=A0A1E7JLT1_9ACTN|nr:HAMP domain-containing sensor histidine kinase [Streptomyces abyssalis]OEU88603.1 histidine kinase [Streptomyces abyssalis]OEU91252.1 histidine kinase [Streptomyces abyssalis]OEV03835.1 histidine kinase [Streptomyces nanshensis]
MLIAVVCAVIGTVTAIAVNSSLESRLDDELRASVQRSYGPPGASVPRPDDMRFVAVPGQPIGTVGARTGDDGGLTGTARSTDLSGGPAMDLSDRLARLTAEQSRALEKVPRDGRPHTVSLPELGDYRVQSGAPPGEEAGLLVGLPMSGVQSTLKTLVVVEVCVSAAGLVAAGIAGAATVRIALRPLRRVAATATKVTRLPLHSGDVELPHRVSERDTDPRTEVGQVGAALNSMLGHVGAALEARQESETRVRQFVADASHELRTPLASIRGYAELTRRVSRDPRRPGKDAGTSGRDAGSSADGGAQETVPPWGPDALHALDRIEAEAARMSGLVEDLLLLARLDAGRPLEREPVSLSSLVVDAVSDARAAGPRHLWRLELPAEPVEVPGDGMRLQQVLGNLLANARTHTPPGSTVTARVRSEPEGREGRQVVVEVEDDGPGIPADVLPHVFERFARGDATRSRAHGSTGLGLAIVEAVVTAHHGRVSADSAPGSTVFAVRFPSAAHAAHAEQPEQASRSDSQPTQRLSTPS